MSTYVVNEVYSRDELEATGSAMIKAHEHGHDLSNWRPIRDQMRVAGL